MYSRFSIIAVIITFLVLSAAANAATYVVDRTDDGGGTLYNACTAAPNDCSLRGAIFNANQNGIGHDTINFDIPGVGPHTINFASQMWAITSSLTINGATQSGYFGKPMIELNGANVAGADWGLGIDSNDGITVTIMALAINRFAGHGVGVSCTGGCSVNLFGNFIGTNTNGDAALPNGEYGVHVILAFSGSAKIGGGGIFEGNVISGNGLGGVLLAGPNLTVQGNHIGTNFDGTAAIPNTWDGVFINAKKNESYLIGGTLPGQGNLISGNQRNGIRIFTYHETEPGTSDLTIRGNTIGTNKAGTSAIPNNLGVYIMGKQPFGSTPDVVLDLHSTIGGTGPEARNLISGNNVGGIAIGSGTSKIYGNYIGTNKNGNGSVGNIGAGISLYGANSAVVGGTLIQAGIGYDVGNVISGNLGNQGIGIHTYDMVDGPVTIQRNRIGTDPSGTFAVPNEGTGIVVRGDNVLIGSKFNNFDGNIISGNSWGIDLLGASNTEIYANKIGTNGIGGAAMANTGPGITIRSGGQNNRIGLAGNDQAVNVISGNQGHGIEIYTSGNRIENNLIGTGPIGNDLGNIGSGINIFDSTSNFIGGGNGAGNTIAFNSTGVRVLGNSLDNEIRRNAIYSNDGLGIDLGPIGPTANDAGDADTGPNRLQNYPVLNRATPNAISGTLNSTPGGNFTVDFYRVDSCDASGYGEGRYYLGSASVQTNALTGDGSFEFPATLSIGQVVTATATVTNIIGADDTSEFSQCKVVTPAPTISFSNANYSVSEGAASRTIIVTRAGATDGVATVDFSTSNGTATAGSDYSANSGTLVFGDGETIKTFDVTILADTLDEDDETVNLTLSNPTGGAALVNPSSAVLTITDNDDPPTISIADVSANEENDGTSSFDLAVSLSSASSKQITVAYASANGTANAGSDYIATNGGVTFAPGETLKFITVSVYGDTDVEPDETFLVNLSNPVNASIFDGQGVGTILNDDAAYSIRGEIRKADNSPIASVAVNLTGSQNGQTMTDVNGRYSFENLSQGGSYTVTPVLAGWGFTPEFREYSNLNGDVTNAHFTGAIEHSRQTTVISGYAIPGGTGAVSLEFESQGNENSLSFSLEYDETLLGNPQVTLQPDGQNANLLVDLSIAGRIGMTIALPAGQAFPAGSLNLAAVSFDAVMTNAQSTPVNFADEPTARNVITVNGEDVTSGYTNGFVFFSQGYESDVSPRPTGSGDGTIVQNDLDEIAKFVVGLAQVHPIVNEFQRADSAPRSSLGNGVLSVADYVQAGRYLAGADPLTEAGGAVASINLNAAKQLRSIKPEGGAAIIRIVNSVSSPGSVANVVIEGDLNGNENAAAFTVNFDPAKLLNPQVLLGNDAQNAQLYVNSSEPGKIGVMLALPTGQAFTAGVQQLVAFRFTIANNVPAGFVPLTFDSTKAVTEVVDLSANEVQSVFQNGHIEILGPTSAEVSISGRVLGANGRPLAGITVMLTDINGAIRWSRTSTFGYYRISGVRAGESYTITPIHKRYEFTPIVLMATDDLAGIDFVAQ